MEINYKRVLRELKKRGTLKEPVLLGYSITYVKETASRRLFMSTLKDKKVLPFEFEQRKFIFEVPGNEFFLVPVYAIQSRGKSVLVQRRKVRIKIVKQENTYKIFERLDVHIEANKLDDPRIWVIKARGIMNDNGEIFEESV